MKRVQTGSGVTGVLSEGVKTVDRGTKITAAITSLCIHHPHWQCCWQRHLPCLGWGRSELQKAQDFHSEQCENETIGEIVFYAKGLGGNRAMQRTYTNQNLTGDVAKEW